MFCPQCGHPNPDNAKFCAGCGKPLPEFPGTARATTAASAPQATATAQPQQPTATPSQSYTYDQASSSPVVEYGTPVQPANSNDTTLRMVAFIFCILSCVGFGWLIVPLIWMVPMTVHAYGIYKGNKPNTMAFGICTLIFCNFIAGILLLLSTKDE